jgi:dTDP-4-dehydrorhamnose reductase
VSRLVVTGAGGMLGAPTAGAARGAGYDVHAAARADLDVCDERAVASALGRLRPEVVINCAAWTDVDGAELDPEGAHLVNATGAGNVARAASAVGARMLHVSSDYVFDGRATRPYVESDPTAPQSAYGASKLAGEQEVLAAGAEHLVVRTSWLFGAGGKNFVDTMLRLAAEGREELGVVDDQCGCPTWTGHLADALVHVAQQGPSGILHAAAGGSCTWNELAREIFAQRDLQVRVLATSSAEMSRPAPRPAYSVLGSERHEAPRLPDWRAGVRSYLSASAPLGAGASSRGAPL